MNPGPAPFRIVIATGNAGKIHDFKAVFEGLDFSVEILSMQSFGGMPDVEETEPDFAGNARLKASAAQKVVKSAGDVWVLADDSGLSVDVLHGAPGVHSARFAGAQATDAGNREKLLELLKPYAQGQRKAHFTCHLCLISPHSEVFDFTGICEGHIAFAASGHEGFGYDSLFIPEGEHHTWGETGGGHKNAESHRARATRQLVFWLRDRCRQDGL